MRYTFIIVFLHLFHFGASQTVALFTQGQVDSFVCQTSIHSLQIGSALEDSDIDDISKLSCIHTLWGGGLVVVNNPHLKTLNGLQNITNINGALIIQTNDSLTNLVGLPTSYNCTEPTDYWRYIRILANNSLEDLEGFPYASDLDKVSISGADNIKNINYFPHFEGLNNLTIALSNLDNLDALLTYDTIPGELFIASKKLPSLHGLDSLKHCQKIVLKHVDSIPNLEGLGALDSVYNFTIESCDKLKNFSGLNNLRVIKNDLKVKNNESLENFIGIENIDKIGFLKVHDNPSLINFSGLDSLKLIKSLVCENNPNLISIDHLNAQLDGELKIENCNNLQHVNKTHGIGYNITIKNNNRLKSYGPFPDITPFTATEIEITNNDSLTSIEGLMGLKRVDHEIYDADLRISANSLLPSIKGLDSLNYTGHFLVLKDNNIHSLINLSNLDSVGYNLIFFDKNPFTSLHGLESLKYIGNGTGIEGDYIKDISALADNLLSIKTIYFGNNLLETISGFNQLNENSRKLRLEISDNHLLKEIKGFKNIDSLYNQCYICNNNSLQLVKAFSNATFSDDLDIHNNPNLTDISGLCHLFTEGTIDGTIEIHDNATGFNSVQEIKDWCITPTDDLPTYDAISVYPNPTSSTFFVDVPMELIQVGMMVDLVDISGVSHFSARIRNTVSAISVDDLPPGLYFLRIVFDGRMVQVKKILVERF